MKRENKIESTVNDLDTNNILVLQTQDFRVSQEKEPCIGLTQENSIENSIQDSLSYILKPHGLC